VLCCSFDVRSSAPVAAPAASSASTALLVGHPSYISVAWRVVGQFLPCRVYSPFIALTVLTHWLLPSRDLTGSSTRGEADSVHLAGCGAATPLGGELLASSPHSSSLGRCWAAVRQAYTMSRSWHAGTGWIIFVCFSRQSLIRQGLAWQQRGRSLLFGLSLRTG
jgi:hypothetical protein